MTPPIHFTPDGNGSESACLGNVRIGLVAQQDNGPAWWKAYFGEPTSNRTELGMTLPQAKRALLNYLSEAFDKAEQPGLACLTREQARGILESVEEPA